MRNGRLGSFGPVLPPFAQRQQPPPKFLPLRMRLQKRIAVLQGPACPQVANKRRHVYRVKQQVLPDLRDSGADVPMGDL